MAIMRKLALAVHATVTRDEPFLLTRLFPGKPWRIPREATNTNSENNAVELMKPDIKKSDIKKSDIKTSGSELPRRPRLRLPMQPLSLPLPT